MDDNFKKLAIALLSQTIRGWRKTEAPESSDSESEYETSEPSSSDTATDATDTEESDSDDSTDEDSEDSGDDILAPPPAKMRRLENVSVLGTLLPQLNGKSFQGYFNMNQEIVYMLIERLNQTAFVPQHSFGTGCITAEKTFLIALSYLTNNESFSLITSRFKCSSTSAQRCLMRGLKFIIDLHDEFVKWPISDAAKRHVSQNFAEDHQMKYCIGAMDTCHVKITAPRRHRRSYMNQQEYHSVIVQGVCQHDMQFIDIHYGEPGGLRVTQVLKRSKLFSNDLNFLYFGNLPCPNSYVVGGMDYPNLEWLVAPFGQDEDTLLNMYQTTFDEKHSGSLEVIKSAFALLKARFGRLEHVNNHNIEYCVMVIKACVILHNICIAYGDDTPLNIAEFADNKVNILDNDAIDSDDEAEAFYYCGIDMRSIVFDQMFPDE